MKEKNIIKVVNIVLLLLLFISATLVCFLYKRYYKSVSTINQANTIKNNYNVHTPAQVLEKYFKDLDKNYQRKIIQLLWIYF